MRLNVESTDELYRTCVEILSKSYEQIDGKFVIVFLVLNFENN